VLYEALAGHRPFVGPSSVAVLDAKLKGSPARLAEAARAGADEIPDAVDELVMKALARHPSQRFQTATEMRQAMAGLRGGSSRRRGKRAVGALAFTMIALFGVAAFAVKGKPLRASLPWLHARPVAAFVAAPAPPATAAPAASEEVVDLGPIDDGVEDGDFVDDGLPPAPPEPAASAAPAADPSPPAASAEPVAVAEKPHHRRHTKTKASRPDDAAPGDGAKTDKPARHKHKAKVARVE
jgi:serine/threonine-protein kinase